jgi:hypothetical protein
MLVADNISKGENRRGVVCWELGSSHFINTMSNKLPPNDWLTVDLATPTNRQLSIDQPTTTYHRDHRCAVH